MSKTTYAVLGAGNGGQCIYAYLKLKGYQASLYDRYPQVLQPILDRGGINLKGVSLNGFADADRVTGDLARAVEGADVILVVLPAFAHAYIAENTAPLLRDGQTVILCPGSTGGVLEFRQVLKARGCTAKIKLAETNSLFYACRVDEGGDAIIGGIKSAMPIASLPAGDVQEIVELLRDPYPQLVPETNVLTSDMSNMNAVVHPFPVLCNLGWIESTGGDFLYYYQGITPSVCRLVEQVDAERMAICEKLGVKAKTIQQSMQYYYGVQGKDLCEMLHNVEAYAIVKAPGRADSRLLSEDIPMGVVPMTELGRLVGVPTPMMDMCVELASRVLDRDLRAEGRTLEKLGVAGMTVPELLAYVG